MARRRSMYGKQPDPPRAFMGSNQMAVYAAIRKLAAEQRWMAVRDLTIEDLRQLFIPAGYRHSLKEAFGLTAARYQDHEMPVEVTMPNPEYNLAQGEQLLATFKWDHSSCPEGFYVPRDAKILKLQPDISDELHEKWNYVGDALARIGWEFGLVQMVFENLNKNGFCNTAQQMRFVWPAIRHIVDRAGIKDLDLVEASARAGDKARVPDAIKPFLVPTVNIINRTTLIEVPDMTGKREFKLYVNSPQYVINSPMATGGLLFSGVS